MNIEKQKCAWCGVEAEQVVYPIQTEDLVLKGYYCHNCKIKSSSSDEYYGKISPNSLN